MNNEATTTDTTATTTPSKTRGKRNRKATDRPVPGKVYQLTGGEGVAAISNGNTWAESEVGSDQAAIVATAAERLAAERDARVAAARAEIEAEDAAKLAAKPAACGTDGRVPDLRLMSDRAATPAPETEEPEFATEDAADQPAAPAATAKPKRERKAPGRPAAKSAARKPAVKATAVKEPRGLARTRLQEQRKATAKAKPAAAPGKTAKAAKPAGVPAWQVDAAKTAANPIQGGVVLALLKKGALTDDLIAAKLGKSHAWTNRTTLSLAHVGLTVRERDGRSIVNRLKK